MNQLERFRDIYTFLFDVDGVLTNSELIVLENGTLLRKMNVRDGYAIKRAIDEGYRVCIITGGKSLGVETRLRNLGVTDIYKGVHNKLEVYEDYLHDYQIDEETVLYMGDDLPDYEVMRRVALPTCPKNAAPEIIRIAQYVASRNGGEGCVREVIEKVMRIHGKWLETAE